eukprot:CAMPEP_0174701400 /NCGR_PEP_ID=MMETSP1094-20130205/6048_1 /TAXON_ID=156173 /ORGANISM="Chrysochromulina brevifilum, Strain UTEX LB 985" /LENGTH=170 /DNA_ID=CAMNT_0015899035 /DNA_START=44 /DNA_END=553 /DNA_ORIENTATION=+
MAVLGSDEVRYEGRTPIGSKGCIRHLFTVACPTHALLIAMLLMNPASATTFTTRDALLEARDLFCENATVAESKYGNASQWSITSEVTNLDYLVCGDGASTSQQYGCNEKCALVKSFPFLDNLDTSEVTTMKGMFYNAEAFNQAVAFNTSKVTTMEEMFRGAAAFNQAVA